MVLIYLIRCLEVIILKLTRHIIGTWKRIVLKHGYTLDSPFYLLKKFS